MCEVVARYEGSAVNGIRPIEIGRLISVSLDGNILETTGATYRNIYETVYNVLYILHF